MLILARVGIGSCQARRRRRGVSLFGRGEEGRGHGWKEEGSYCPEEWRWGINIFRRTEEGRYSFIPERASLVTVACTLRDSERASAAHSAGGNHKVRSRVLHTEDVLSDLGILIVLSVLLCCGFVLSSGVWGRELGDEPCSVNIRPRRSSAQLIGPRQASWEHLQRREQLLWGTTGCVRASELQTKAQHDFDIFFFSQLIVGYLSCELL